MATTQISKNLLRQTTSAAAATTTSRQINAVVVTAGLMQKTVKVRIGTQKWDGHIQKKYSKTTHLLVHDPNSSLRAGDVISISPGWRVSKSVHHVVNSIIAPFGSDISSRPAVPTEAERIAKRDEDAKAKVQRRAEKRLAEKQAEEERERGLVEEEKLRRKQEAARKKRRARAERVRVALEGEGEGEQELVSEVVREEVSERLVPEPESVKEQVVEPPKKRGWFS